MKKLLIIDDDKDIGNILSIFFKKNGFEVENVFDGEGALKILREDTFDSILCDYKLPDTSGLEMVQKINILNPKAAVVIITGYSDLRTAVEVLKHGAMDYVTKPLYPEEILSVVQQSLDKKSEKFDLVTKETVKRKINSGGNKKENIEFGSSPQSQQLDKHIELIAPTDMSVIITGETGTGKEYVAKAIHQKSTRVNEAFIAIDCGALSKELAGSELFGHVKGAFTGATSNKIGSFEAANGGTIFLDEIGNLSYDNQVKLLRVLQERKIKRIGSNEEIDINVRVIVATNENLKQEVKNGNFREDIYHRLNEFSIQLVPLRERVEDIEFFANKFIDLANDRLNKNVSGLSKEVLCLFENYHWYGNLRELQNLIKRAVLLTQGEEITKDALPDEVVHPKMYQSNSPSNRLERGNDLKAAAHNAERETIIDVLKQSRYNKTKAAKILQIDRKTLYKKLKSYEIEID